VMTKKQVLGFKPGTGTSTRSARKHRSRSNAAPSRSPAAFFRRDLRGGKAWTDNVDSILKPAMPKFITIALVMTVSVLVCCTRAGPPTQLSAAYKSEASPKYRTEVRYCFH